MKAFTRVSIIFSVFILSSCRTKSSDAFYYPFCKTYSFSLKGNKYLLNLTRDTSGGFISYAGNIAGESNPGFFEIHTTPDDTARAGELVFSFYDTNITNDFSGTFSSSDATINGFIKTIRADGSKDSVSCSMNEAGIPPFTFYSKRATYPVLNDSTSEPHEFSLKMLWPRAGVPALAAAKYKDDLRELLEIKDSKYNYSAQEYTNRYEQKFIDEHVKADDEGNVMPARQEEIATSLVYAGEKWMVLGFYKLFYDGMMAHSQWYNKHTMYDMRTGKHLNLHNFFTPNAFKKMPSLLAKYFKLQNDLQPGEPLTKAGLYDNYINPGKGYFVTGKVVVFHYGNYEIAPFYKGEFDIAIPLSEFGNDFFYNP